MNAIENALSWYNSHNFKYFQIFDPKGNIVSKLSENSEATLKLRNDSFLAENLQLISHTPFAGTYILEGSEKATANKARFPIVFIKESYGMQTPVQSNNPFFGSDFNPMKFMMEHGQLTANSSAQQREFVLQREIEILKYNQQKEKELLAEREKAEPVENFAQLAMKFFMTPAGGRIAENLMSKIPDDLQRKVATMAAQMATMGMDDVAEQQSQPETKPVTEKPTIIFEPIQNGNYTDNSRNATAITEDVSTDDLFSRRIGGSQHDPINYAAN
jgi:hypothetical protein